MATITLTIPDGIIQRVIDGVCLANNYQDTINGVPNTETKAQFAKRMLKEQTIRWIKQAEVIAASNAAAETASGNVDSTITIT